MQEMKKRNTRSSCRYFRSSEVFWCLLMLSREWASKSTAKHNGDESWGICCAHANEMYSGNLGHQQNNVDQCQKKGGVNRCSPESSHIKNLAVTFTSQRQMLQMYCGSGTTWRCLGLLTRPPGCTYILCNLLESDIWFSKKSVDAVILFYSMPVCREGSWL